MIKRFFLIAIMSTAIGTNAGAQDPLNLDDAVVKVRENFINMTHVECVVELDRLRKGDLNPSLAPGIEAEAVEKTAESVRLLCESLRMQDLIATAKGRAQKARANAAKLEGIPEESERRKKLLRSVKIFEIDIRVHTHDAEGLILGAERILRLAAAIDSGVQNDLLRRLLGEPPQPVS